MQDLKMQRGKFFFFPTYPRPEAVVRRCSIKKAFLKISQNSQKNHLSVALKSFPASFAKFLRTSIL